MERHDYVRHGELGEAEYLYQWYELTDDSSRQRLGMTATRLGGGVVTVMANDPTGGFFSRALGLGIDRPLTQDVLDEAFAFAVDHGGSTLLIQVSPEASPDTHDELLALNGCTPSMAWAKFVGYQVEPPDVATDLRVQALGAEHGERFAEIMAEGFSMPTEGGLPEWFAQMPTWEPPLVTTYGAFDGDDLVATAMLVAANGIGSLCGAVTLESHRGRGAQGALMARRIRDSHERGCPWLTTETWTETPENPNPSLHNMRRMGFTELYERRNWIWRVPEPLRAP